MKNKRILGIDIGGTNIKAGLVSEDGTTTNHCSIPTREWIQSGDFISRLKEFIKSYDDGTITSCGIAIPGTIDSENNKILFIPAIPCLQYLNLKDTLKKEFPHLYISVENDSNAAAYGEYRLQPEKIRNGMFLITLGTGVGCGLILNNELFKGGNGNALELGEILSDNNERLEDRIGVSGIQKMANPEAAPNPLSVPDIIRRANENDPFATKIMNRVGQILGRAVVHAFWLFDVYNIVLGGGISEAFPAIKDGMNRFFEEILPENILEKVHISKALSGNHAGLIGAALCCFREN